MYKPIWACGPSTTRYFLSKVLKTEAVKRINESWASGCRSYEPFDWRVSTTLYSVEGTVWLKVMRCLAGAITSNGHFELLSLTFCILLNVWSWPLWWIWDQCRLISDINQNWLGKQLLSAYCVWAWVTNPGQHMDKITAFLQMNSWLC